MKACTKCRVEKAESEFYLTPQRKPKAECKACTKARARAAALANPEKTKANHKRFHEAHPNKAPVYARRWQAANRPKIRAAHNAWRKANPEKCAAMETRRRALHPKWYAAKKARYYVKHKAECLVRVARRAAAELQATPSWANHVAVGEFYALAAIKTRLTGESWHVDHQVPLRSKYVCGLHTDYNLQVLRGVDNIRKGNRFWPDMPQALHA